MSQTRSATNPPATPTVSNLKTKSDPIHGLAFTQTGNANNSEEIKIEGEITVESQAESQAESESKTQIIHQNNESDSEDGITLHALESDPDFFLNKPRSASVKHLPEEEIVETLAEFEAKYGAVFYPRVANIQALFFTEEKPAVGSSFEWRPLELQERSLGVLAANAPPEKKAYDWWTPDVQSEASEEEKEKRKLIYFFWKQLDQECKAQGHLKDNASLFTAPGRPCAIPLIDYYQRIETWSGIDPDYSLLDCAGLSATEGLTIICLLFGFKQLTGIKFDARNIHRLLITAGLTIAKNTGDWFFDNAFFARMGGIPTAELNALEFDFLFRMRFKILPFLGPEYHQAIRVQLKELYLEAQKRAAKSEDLRGSESLPALSVMNLRVQVPEDKNEDKILTTRLINNKLATRGRSPSLHIIESDEFLDPDKHVIAVSVRNQMQRVEKVKAEGAKAGQAAPKPVEENQHILSNKLSSGLYPQKDKGDKKKSQHFTFDQVPPPKEPVLPPKEDVSSCKCLIL